MFFFYYFILFLFPSGISIVVFKSYATEVVRLVHLTEELPLDDGMVTAEMTLESRNVTWRREHSSPISFSILSLSLSLRFCTTLPSAVSQQSSPCRDSVKMAQRNRFHGVVSMPLGLVKWCFTPECASSHNPHSNSDRVCWFGL